jgi:hypothetical protein
MSSKLYLSNFPPDLKADQMQEILAEFVPVVSVTFFKRPSGTTMPPGARIEIEPDDVTDALKKLNGYTLGEHRLGATVMEVPPKPELSPEIEEEINAIAEKLGETEKVALRQIKDIRLLCGPDFTQAVLEDAEKVEESGGMKTVDGSRNRTFGGVFFYLARGRMAPALRKVIFFNKSQKAGKKDSKDKKAKDSEKEKAKSAPAAPPPPVPDDLAGDPQERLGQLQQALSEAEQHLEIVKANPEIQQGGTFSAIKAVLDIKKQISNLLKQHPDLA